MSVRARQSPVGSENLPLTDPAASAGAPRLALARRPAEQAAAGAAPQGELWAAVHLPGGGSPETLAVLAMRAQRFTPRVSLEPPDGLVLEVRGSLHLFAGLAGLRRQLLVTCQEAGLQPVLAFAPTPLAALVAARSGVALTVYERAALTGALAPLPLAGLRWEPQVSERLKRAGVRTIGALLRLPRAGFARRFGAAQLAMLDALTGQRRELRALFKDRERFRRRCELSCELESQAWLLAALEPLLDELESFLRAREYGVMHLEWRLLHRQAPASRCILELATPAADARLLAQLFAERLASCELPEGVRSFELRADTLFSRAPQAPSLWRPGEHGGGAGHESFGLIERLRARLGADAVHGLTLLAGHRPERSFARSAPPPPRGARAALGTGSAPPGTARPLWLLPEPQALSVRDGLPRRRGALTLVSEAERIESGWWDGAEIERDYYVACDAHGVRLWLFRERGAPHGWYLHGLFG
jgi:protein ImuB